MSEIFPFPIQTDETLPPDCVKFLGDGVAVVFGLDLESETATEIARWPERPERHWGECAYCSWRGPERTELLGAIHDAKAHQLNCEMRP